MYRSLALMGGVVPLLMVTSFARLWDQGAERTAPADEPPGAEVRTFDGSANHPARFERGAAGRPFTRWVSASAPAGDRASPRDVSTAVHAQPEGRWTTPDPKGRSVLFAVFGQFLSHDISLRAKTRERRYVHVGPGDPHFAEGAMLPFVPSAPHPETGTPFNLVSAWIDGSMIYGSDPCRAIALREWSGGRLRTSADGQLPRYGWSEPDRACLPPGAAFAGCPAELEVENPRRVALSSLFLAGDIRANENPVLLSLHTIFVREHNRHAEQLARRHPSWGDERLYAEARRWVGALLQAVTYHEYLPLLLGADALPPYAGYRPEAAEQVSLEFTMAAFRFGHSQMGPMLYRNGPDGEEFEFSDVSLKAGYYATPVYEQAGGGPGAWLAGAAAFRAQPVDRFIIDDLRNYMFGGLRGGLDVAAINIAVGREAGLGSFADLRSTLGLPPLAAFVELSSDPALARRLEDLYGDVDDVDPWVGLLVESASDIDAADRTIEGATLRAALAEGFRRLRDGDRFHFENDPALSSQRDVIRRTRLAEIIRRNMRGRWASARFEGPAFLAWRDHRGDR